MLNETTDINDEWFHDMSFHVVFFLLELVSQFLSDSQLNPAWNH